MKTRLCITTILLLLVLPQVGCNGRSFGEWWHSSDTIDELNEAKTVLDNAVEAVEAEMRVWRGEMEKLQEEGLTAAEEVELQRLQRLIDNGENGLMWVHDQMDDVDEALANASTNGDVVLGVGGTVAAIFGVPYVPLLTRLFKRTKLVSTLVGNLERAKDPTAHTIDLDKLRTENMASGINDIINSLRGKSPSS